jgi:hypothetical protein
MGGGSAHGNAFRRFLRPQKATMDTSKSNHGQFKKQPRGVQKGEWERQHSKASREAGTPQDNGCGTTITHAE